MSSSTELICKVTFFVALGILSSCTRPEIACAGAQPTLSFPKDADLRSAQSWATALNKTRSEDNLQCWSQNGDRAASFALGSHYLDDVGIPSDRGKAKEMFELAAQPVVETRSYYGAPVGGENYSVPVTAPISKESVVKYPALEMISALDG